MHVHLPRQRDARSHALPGHLSHESTRRRRTNTTVTSSTTRNSSPNVEESIAVYTSDELEDGQRRLRTATSNSRTGSRKGGINSTSPARSSHYLCEPGARRPEQLEQYLALLRRQSPRPGGARPHGAAAHRVLQAGSRKLRAGLRRQIAERPHRRRLRRRRERRASRPRCDSTPTPATPLKTLLRRGARREALTRATCATSSTPTSRPIPPRTPAQLGEHSLVELIVDTGINDAIAQELNARGKLSQATRSPRPSSTTCARPSSATSSPIRASTPRCRSSSRTSSSQRQAQTLDYEDFLDVAGRGTRPRDEQRATPRAVPAASNPCPRAHVVYRNLRHPRDQWRLRSTDSPRGLGRAYAKTRRGHARARSGGLEGRNGRGPKKSRVVNALYALLQKDKAATYALFDLLKRCKSTTKHLPSARTHPRRRPLDRPHPQRRSQRAALGAPARRPRHDGRAGRHAPRRSARLRHLAPRVDPAANTKLSRASRAKRPAPTSPARPTTSGASHTSSRSPPPSLRDPPRLSNKSTAATQRISPSLEPSPTPATAHDLPAKPPRPSAPQQ